MPTPTPSNATPTPQGGPSAVDLRFWDGSGDPCLDGAENLRSSGYGSQVVACLTDANGNPTPLTEDSNYRLEWGVGDEAVARLVHLCEADPDTGADGTPGSCPGALPRYTDELGTAKAYVEPLVVTGSSDISVCIASDDQELSCDAGTVTFFDPNPSLVKLRLSTDPSAEACDAPAAPFDASGDTRVSAVVCTYNSDGERVAANWTTYTHLEWSIDNPSVAVFEPSCSDVCSYASPDGTDDTGFALGSIVPSGQGSTTVRVCVRSEWWDREVEIIEPFCDDQALIVTGPVAHASPAPDLSDGSISPPDGDHLSIVSRTEDGAVAEGWEAGRISGNGRYAFWQHGLPSGEAEILVRDLETGTIDNVGIGRAARLSDNGRFVLYSNTDDYVNWSVMLADRVTHTKKKLATSGTPLDISQNGRFVLFLDGGRLRLLDRDTDGNGAFDEANGTYEYRISDESFAARVSDNGRFVALSSTKRLIAEDGYDSPSVYLFDTQARSFDLLLTGNAAVVAGVSNDGTRVLVETDESFVEDDLGRRDLYMIDRQDATLSLVSGPYGDENDEWSSAYAEWGQSMSEDGRYVVYDSTGNESRPSREIILADVETGSKQMLSLDSEGGLSGDSSGATITDDGARVLFSSSSPTLDPSHGELCTWNDEDQAWYGCSASYLRDLRANAAGQVAPSGGTIATVGEVTQSNPVGASITVPQVPAGYSSTVSISVSAVTEPAAQGYEFLGQQLNIEAPPATWSQPLRMSFTLDASSVPEDQDESTIQIFRNGVALPDCLGSDTALPPADGSEALGEGDPCLTSRSVDAQGDVTLVVLTPHASRWNFGTVLDSEAPIVEFGGNRGSYTVDETVAITCSARDAQTGVASQDCTDTTGPAYSFGLGAHVLTASATDGAGNVGTATARFSVTVTYDSLCNLTRRFLSQADAAQRLGDSLCMKLDSSRAAKNKSGRDQSVNGFMSQVRAQSGKALTTEHANVLLDLATGLTG